MIRLFALTLLLMLALLAGLGLDAPGRAAEGALSGDEAAVIEPLARRLV